MVTLASEMDSSCQRGLKKHASVEGGLSTNGVTLSRTREASVYRPLIGALISTINKKQQDKVF